MTIRLELALLAIIIAALGCLIWASDIVETKQDSRPLCICPHPAEPTVPKEGYVDPAVHEWVEGVIRESLKNL